MHGSRVFLGLALAACFPLIADARSSQAASARTVESAATALSQEEAISAEQLRLAAARADFPNGFAAAYKAYPQLPSGVLESIAYVQTRWVMIEPASDLDGESAPAVGVMGLYHGGPFRDQVGEAAALLGSSRQAVERDAAINILAAAALLSKAQKEAGGDASLAQILAAYAGFRGTDGDAINDFARESFAYDVLLALDRGSDDNGIRIAARPVEWEREFAPAALVRQHAPFVRLDLSRGSVEAGPYAIDPLDETLHERTGVMQPATGAAQIHSTDYAPALWVASPYHGTRSQAISAVTIHTMQGSYAGTISWFKSNPYSTSAHYLVRSSDGQITQMVRESAAAYHARSANPYTLGIEHEGYTNNAAWYTTAMYNASAALTRHFCARYAIACTSAYKGAASSTVNVLPASVKIKGHQHFPGQDHTDPGINWNWSRYYGLLNPGGGGGGNTIMLDKFETGEGHFNTAPAYSGSTTGISASSTADRDCAMARVGNCSEHLRLIDNASNTSNWSVRFLSGSGAPASNMKFARNGRVGFWVFVAGSGFSVGLGVDDSDGTERSTLKAVPANAWTYVEWSLADAAQWNAWVGGNGAITAAQATLDAIWIERAHTTYTVNVHIDDVRWVPN
ncbi:peptidoglycan recognition family protein [Dokdonella sp.]|uniref:N-acetylmuramoyl-L-alanine amidase n=1 Tax=Dokdonella sp. TaxID=2291710 RepID=UPI0025C73A5E|nr:peptidoglycan recognition family protein [Dokdonella sp.]MBX3687900.1 N-acetylmuramoyl-L-alanine amidase [Dokdonella sp.]